MSEKVKDKKYYWLRLKSDFFERPEMKYVEAMPEGKDYILFYLKLLCKSIDHEGKLRFTDNIPYNSSMLSVVTNTSEEIIEKAIEVFTGLQMMELLDDGTYFMREVEKMMGSETYWAQKKREQKAREEAQRNEIGKNQITSNQNQTVSNESKEEREKDTELYLYQERETDGAPSPNDEGWIDWAWENIKDIYPREEGVEAAKPKFLEIMKRTPDEEKQRTHEILCSAMKLYKRNHDKKNPDDVGVYKYALGLKNWFDTESKKWIKEAERRERDLIEAKKREVEAADNEDSLTFDSERLEMLSAEEKEELIVWGALVMRETDALVYPRKIRFEKREELVIRGVLPCW